MSKKHKSFIEEILDAAGIQAVIEASRNSDGTIDPYKAGGMAWGLGYDLDDIAVELGRKGAFDPPSKQRRKSSSGRSASKSGRASNWREYADEGLEYDLDPEDYETLEEYEEALQEAKYGWRKEAEDGWEYDLDPKDYETLEEYEEALQEAKYGWRSEAEDGWEYDLNPEDYETAEEYEEALQEAKYGWREEAEDGWEYDLNPEDYETAEEYEEAFQEALQEAKYGWREDAEDGSEYDLDPENYETAEEYEEALQEAKYGWREEAEDGWEYDLDPEDYETAEEYEEALQEAKYGWREEAEDGWEYDLNPEDYETAEEYEDALEQARYGWRDDAEEGFIYGLSPYDYETLEAYEAAIEDARATSSDEEESDPEDDEPEDGDAYIFVLTEDGEYISLAEQKRRALQEKTECLPKSTSWREHVEFDPNSDLDPYDFETEEDFNAARLEEKYAWRSSCEDGSDYGLNPEDFEWEEDYVYELQQARYGWREQVEDGRPYQLRPEKFETRQDYEEALYEAKYGWRAYAKAVQGLDPFDFETEAAYEEAVDRMEAQNEEAESNRKIDLKDLLSPLKYTPAPDASQDLLRRQKHAVEYYEHYKGFERYNQHLISEGHLKLCRFILESEQTVAKYLTVDGDILWGQAIRDHFDVPIRIKKETNKSETPLTIIMDRLIRKDPALAFKVWRWCYELYFSIPELRWDALETELIDSVINFRREEEYLEQLLNFFPEETEIADFVFTPRGAVWPVCCFLREMAKLAREKCSEDLVRYYIRGLYRYAHRDVEELCEAIKDLLWSSYPDMTWVDKIWQIVRSELAAANMKNKSVYEKKIPQWQKMIEEWKAN